MGLKVSFKPSKKITDPGRIGIPKIINLHNWRAAIENYVDDPEGITIITRNCRVIFFEGLTFNQLNYFNSIHIEKEIPYRIIRNHLTCIRCRGVGKADWVQITRGKSPRSFILEELDFRRKPGKITVVEYKGKTFLLSQPLIKTGEELCPSCFGSGIYFKDKATKINEIKE